MLTTTSKILFIFVNRGYVILKQSLVLKGLPTLLALMTLEVGSEMFTHRLICSFTRHQNVFNRRNQDVKLGRKLL